MQSLPRRAGLGGPALTRLLARLTGTDTPASGQSIPDRLSQWLGWADAIALSSALSRALPAARGPAPPVGAEEQECARVRGSLESAIAGAATAQAPVEFASCRQRHSHLQQVMETSIRDLRRRLRAALAAGTPDMMRLAIMDATLENALGPREFRQLAAVPALLEGHFERLRRCAPEDGSTPTPSWLSTFNRDMQSVLLAELDIRMQPIEGLLAALRAHSPKTP